jgi:hypothetical protein
MNFSQYYYDNTPYQESAGIPGFTVPPIENPFPAHGDIKRDPPPNDKPSKQKKDHDDAKELDQEVKDRAHNKSKPARAGLLDVKIGNSPYRQPSVDKPQGVNALA